MGLPQKSIYAYPPRFRLHVARREHDDRRTLATCRHPRPPHKFKSIDAGRLVVEDQPVAPLSAAARRIAEVLCGDATTGECVFANPRTGGQLSRIKKGFAAAVHDAGLENFTFRDLRHTFATRPAEAGVDPFAIRDLLGHTTVRMSSDYTHSTPETRQTAIAGLGGAKRPAETERGKIVAIR